MPDHFFLDLLRDEAGLLPRMLIAVAAAGGLAGLARAALVRFGIRDGSVVPAWGTIFPEVAGLALSVACCLVPLTKAWMDAGSDGGCLFGLLPLSDAEQYYKGAFDLLQSGKLDEWNLRRPLNASLLAVRLALSGGGLRGALLLQAALLGGALFALFRTVRRDLGWAGGLAAFVFSLIFATVYLHFVLSEILGLTFGALGLSLLWSSARTGSRRLLGFGSLALTLALHARAGPFLMLPALAIWAFCAWEGGQRARAAACGAVILGVVAATAFNAGIAGIHGGRLENSHGNFYFVLYGLSGGTPGWMRIYDDYPEVRAMPEVAANAFIREKALARIRRHPMCLIEGLAVGWRNFVSHVPEGLEVLETNLPIGGRRWFFLPLLFGGLPVFLWRHGRRRETTMVFSLLAGVLASVPVLWVDGGSRVFAAAVPLLGLVPAFALAGWRPACDLFPDRASASPGSFSGGALMLLTALMISAAAGPSIARSFRATSPPAFLPASSSPSEAIIRSDAPSIRTMVSGASTTTFVPMVTREDFIGKLSLFGNREFRRIPEQGVVMLARDWKAGTSSDRYLYIVGPRELVAGPARYLFVKGDYAAKVGVLNVSEWRDAGPVR